MRPTPCATGAWLLARQPRSLEGVLAVQDRPSTVSNHSVPDLLPVDRRMSPIWETVHHATVHVDLPPRRRSNVLNGSMQSNARSAAPRGGAPTARWRRISPIESLSSRSLRSGLAAVAARKDRTRLRDRLETLHGRRKTASADAAGAVCRGRANSASISGSSASRLPRGRRRGGSLDRRAGLGGSEVRRVSRS